MPDLPPIIRPEVSGWVLENDPLGFGFRAVISL